MKKTATLFVHLVILCLAVQIFAANKKQDSVSGITPKPLSFAKDNSLNLSAALDTLGVNEFFECSPTLYFASAGGYVAGTNAYGDLEKVQRYENAGDGTISQIFVWFGEKTVAGSPGDVVGVIYDVVNDTIPNSLLATSSAVSMTNVDTTGLLTVFSFAEPVEVSEVFYVGIRMSQVTGDTVGVVSTDAECRTTDRAWEKWSDNSWFSIDGAWGGLPIDLAIFPEFETTTTSVEQEILIPDAFTLDQNFPNPFNPSTTISYTLTQTEHVSLKIYNLQGQEIRTLVEARQAAGEQSVQWDGLDNLGKRAASGVYVYKLQSENITLSKKMLLIK